MRAVYFIGIMLFVLFTIGSASAETLPDQQVVLTEDNSNIVVNDGKTIIDGLFKITVDYNPNTGQIVYQYTGNTAPGNGPYITNPKIFEVGYNLDRAGTVSPGNWAPQNSLQFDGFGTFLQGYKIDNQNSVSLNRVTVQLAGSAPYPSFPTQGNAVVLHLAFDTAYDANGAVYEVPPDITFGDSSSYFAGGVNQIPEFPTMALPVAAILGLLFIAGRKRKE